MGKKFTIKKLGSIKNIKSWKEIFTSAVLIKTFVIIACLFIIFMVGKWAWSFATDAGKSVAQFATNFASRQIGEPLQQDRYGNINVMISGFAGASFRGGYLTDTIMLASYNPDEQAVTFLSVPRDLYVNYDNGGSGKINGLYWAAFLEKQITEEQENTLTETEIINLRHQAGASALREKVSEITGVEIPYHAVISFEGFTNFIDKLGGIDIEVPYDLYDNQYPGPNDSYVIFQVDKGWNTFDGEEALKYARSRKTTSDFSRALRQQQIIEAVIDKVTSVENIGNIMDIYDDFDTVVKTNITGKQLLWAGQFLDQDRHYFSFVYTAECNMSIPDLAEPGCLLNYANRDFFGGASVMLPDGATPSNVSYYNKTQDFAFRVVHNQGFLKENAPIRVLNGIDVSAARAQGYYVTGAATDLALELILKGFNIERITNAEVDHETTKIIVPGDGWFPETVDTLGAFVDYKEVIADPSYGSGVSIILGNDYLSNL